MIVTFQVILLIIMIISFMGVVAEKENNNLRTNLTILCIATSLVFLGSVSLL